MDKQTDIVEANHRVGRSSFIKLIMTLLKSSSQMLNSGPTNVCKKEISVEWRNYIANNHATPGKNPTLYKTHKTGVPVSLLTSGCNTAIENLSRFIKVICSPLTEIMQCRIKDTSIYNYTLNEHPISNHAKLVSLDIVSWTCFQIQKIKDEYKEYRIYLCYKKHINRLLNKSTQIMFIQ